MTEVSVETCFVNLRVLSFSLKLYWLQVTKEINRILKGNVFIYNSEKEFEKTFFLMKCQGDILFLE